MSGSLILGFFDGVHIAHRAVIESALNFSQKHGKKTTLITFKESPCLHFGIKPEYILSREDSIKKIKALGVNDIVELDFSKIASMSAEEYLVYLSKTYSPDSISTGFNHTFGLNKTGNSQFLENNQDKYGYKYICVEPCKANEQIVSSTLIRCLLKEGKIKNANSLLESNFVLKGKVEHGAKIGRTIGFPTANISYPEKIVKIPFGVYSVECSIKNFQKMRAIMNWGMKPTVHNTKEPVVEIHILDFNGNLYGDDIKIEILDRIRGEQKFSNIDELKSQIAKDIQTCLKLS